MPLPLIAGYYQIESLADWNTASDEELGPCILAQGFDSGRQLIKSLNVEINLNGKSVLNVDNVRGGTFNNLQQALFGGSSTPYNGHVHFNYNQTFEKFSPIAQMQTGVKNLYFSGSITATGGVANAISDGVGSGYQRVDDIISTVDVTGDSCYVIRGQNFGSTVNNVIYGGTLNGVVNNGWHATGAQGGSTTLSNSFYDSTKNAITEQQAGLAKTTAELQAIATYTDTVNTTGLTTAYDMAESANYSNELWVLAPSSYPELVFTVATEWQPYTLNGNPVSGVVVEYRTHDSLGGQGTLLETVVSNAQGVAPLTAEVPAGKFLSATAFYDDGSDPNSSNSINPRFIAGYPQ